MFYSSRVKPNEMYKIRGLIEREKMFLRNIMVNRKKGVLFLKKKKITLDTLHPLHPYCSLHPCTPAGPDICPCSLEARQANLQKHKPSVREILVT